MPARVFDLLCKKLFCTDALNGGGGGGSGSNGNYIITVPLPSGWPLFRELGENFLAGISKEKAIQVFCFYFLMEACEKQTISQVSNWRWHFLKFIFFVSNFL